MTVVIGTAGHIDHGKTTLLRALTGIDADRLPEERRRGMTIDVGYAHLRLPDGDELDFVDVPGHDRLVGNMLVGAGEIDGALLVVAADDGPRAQTLEHLALLDALAVRHGVVAITKADLVAPERLAEVVAAVRSILRGTSLDGAPILAVAGTTGEGVEALRGELAALRDRIAADRGPRRDPARLAVDRVFAVKGRGTVVTGTLRGGRLATGDSLRVEPGGGSVRIREIQVHGSSVDAVEGGGRTALNVAAVEAGAVRRGTVLSADPEIRATDRLLVRLAGPAVDRSRHRLHLGTDAVEATVGRSGRDALDLPDGDAAGIVRLAAPIAAGTGDRFVLRRSTPAAAIGGVVLDPAPPRGLSRRRQTVERVAALAAAVARDDRPAIAAARIELHGIDLTAVPPRLAADLRTAGETAAVDAVAAHHASHPADAGIPLPALRDAIARTLRRGATAPAETAAGIAAGLVDELVAGGRLARYGDRVRLPDHRPAGPDPALAAAMDRLETALAVPTPPPLAAAASAAGCSPAGIRELERTGRIVVLEPDLAYAMTTYRALAARALALAGAGPLVPAAFRDATGTSRKFVMPILEDLDRRGILRRTPDGHVPGPRAPVAARSRA